MTPIAQLTSIVVMAAAAAGGTFLIKGAPVRTLVCDPAELKEDEVCLEQLKETDPILWIDARPRKDWTKNGLPGALLWNLDPAEDMQSFEAEVVPHLLEAPWVIVYCGDENCGVSRQVAGQIRALGFDSKVSVLRGGWRALREAGRIPAS
jgi:rhodanese-related sulfurtransferase